MNNVSLTTARKVIETSSRTIAITGAGISVASGIPPFRGASGLWKKYNPDIYASLEAFKENPARSWRLFLELYMEFADAKPSIGHQTLAALENSSKLHHIITQNIDGLHQKAGSRSITEIHGSLKNLTCVMCRERISSRGMILDSEDLPPRCHCGGALKPDIVLFGESISSDLYFRALKEIRTSDVLLIIGTSGFVHPVNEFPEIAINHGARLIEINLEETLITKTYHTVFLRGEIDKVLVELFS